MSDVEKEGLGFAGDVRINNVAITTTRGFVATITPQVIGIEIYEDIFSPFITGKITIKDSQELTSIFPLIGEELVYIDVATPGLDSNYTYKGEYYIYKYDDVTQLAERSIVYVLYFCSKEAIVDINKKISKTYDGKISTIASKIMKDPDGLETSKPCNIEETPNSTKFISNFWSPVQCLNYLLENAVNDKDSPSFVFFENKFGLNFVSLGSLISDVPIYQNFIWDNYSQDYTGKVSNYERNLNRDFQRIIEYTKPAMFDYMDRVRTGMYGSQMVTYDLTTKKYTHVGFTPVFHDVEHLNKYPLYSDKVVARPRATLIREHKYLNNFPGYGDVTNTKTLQQRLHLLTLAEAFKLHITVFGRTDYSVGQKVHVSIPKNDEVLEDETADEMLDRVYSGNYLIGALCHLITREKHTCSMELIKDSFIFDLNNAK